MSDLDGQGLQVFLDAAGQRYARRAREAELARWQSPLAWLAWAWFGQRHVPPETVPLAPGRVYVSETIEIPPGVAVTGPLPDGTTRIHGPDDPVAARRFLRDSRIGLRVRLRAAALRPSRRICACGDRRSEHAFWAPDNQCLVCTDGACPDFRWRWRAWLRLP